MTDAEFFAACDEIERKAIAVAKHARKQLEDAEALIIDVRAKRAVARLMAELDDEP